MASVSSATPVSSIGSRQGASGSAHPATSNVAAAFKKSSPPSAGNRALFADSTIHRASDRCSANRTPGVLSAHIGHRPGTTSSSISVTVKNGTRLETARRHDRRTCEWRCRASGNTDAHKDAARLRISATKAALFCSSSALVVSPDEKASPSTNACTALCVAFLTSWNASRLVSRRTSTSSSAKDAKTRGFFALAQTSPTSVARANRISSLGSSAAPRPIVVTSVGTRLFKMGSNDPAHRSTYRARSAKHSSRTFSAASVAPRAAADTTVGASSNSVASQGGGLEASPTKSLQWPIRR